MIVYKAIDGLRIKCYIGEIEVGLLIRESQDKEYSLVVKNGLGLFVKDGMVRILTEKLNEFIHKIPFIPIKCGLCGSSEYLRLSFDGDTSGRLFHSCSLCGWWYDSFWNGGLFVKDFLSSVGLTRRMNKNPLMKDHRGWRDVSVMDTGMIKKIKALKEVC